MTYAPPPPYGQNNYYQQGPPPSMAQPGYMGAQPGYMGAPTIIGNYPAQCTCPQCGKQVVTRIEKKAGTLTWLLCVGICFFVGCIGCCLIPFCIDGCKDTEHYCPSCNALLGVQKQL